MLRAKGYLVCAPHAGCGLAFQQLPCFPLGPIWGWEQVGGGTATAVVRRLVSKGRAVQIGTLQILSCVIWGKHLSLSGPSVEWGNATTAL